MIEIKNVSKAFGDVQAVGSINLQMKEGVVMGLLGTNGAGKSTLLRMISGILKPDHGDILLDGESIWNNPSAKSKLFYISDDQYYFPNATPKEFGSFYSTYFTGFQKERFYELLSKIDLSANRKMKTFSKGMKKYFTT